MNKILANMMLNCNEKITAEQVAKLQEFKDTPGDFDSKKTGYPELLAYNLDQFSVDPSLPAEKQSGPVELSRTEINMQTIVEVSRSNLSYL